MCQKTQVLAILPPLFFYTHLLAMSLILSFHNQINSRIIYILLFTYTKCIMVIQLFLYIFIMVQVAETLRNFVHKKHNLYTILYIVWHVCVVCGNTPNCVEKYVPPWLVQTRGIAFTYVCVYV